MMRVLLCVICLWASVATGATISQQPAPSLPLLPTDSMAAGRVGDPKAYSITVGQLDGRYGPILTNQDPRYYGLVEGGTVDNAAAFTKMSAALATAGGGHIHFPKTTNGRWGTTDTWIINASNVTITADEGASVYAIDNGAGLARHGVIQVNSTPDATGATRLKNIRIENLTVDMSAITPTWDSAWSSIAGLGRGGIWVRNSDNVKLLNNNIIGAVHAGISAVGCSDLKLNGNTINGFRSVVASAGSVHDGNAINVQAYDVGGNLTYAGPWGQQEVSGNHIYGGTMPPSFTLGTSNGCQIGLHIEPAGWKTDVVENQGNPVQVYGNSVEGCWFGTIIEGQKTGDVTHVDVFGNAFKLNVYGIYVWPDYASGGTYNHAYGINIANNEVSYSYSSGIFSRGSNVSITGNKVIDYAMGKNSEAWGGNLPAGGGIFMAPSNSGDPTTDFYSYLAAYNTVKQSTAHTSATYIGSGPGIQVYSLPGMTMHNIDISHNILEGGNSTDGFASSASGIVVLGSMVGVKISHNDVRGFPKYGLFISVQTGTDYTVTPSHVDILFNTFTNNNWNNSSTISAMMVQSANSHYTVTGNRVIDDRGTSQTYQLLEIPKLSGSDSPMDYLYVRNNEATGLLFFDTDCFLIYVTGTHVAIEGNSKFNYRSSVPSSGTAKYYAGTFVANTGAALVGGSGLSYILTGWLCTVTGSPGTWVQIAPTTGSGVGANGIMFGDSTGLPKSLPGHFWFDDTNYRVGIDTQSPSGKLHIIEPDTTTPGILVQNSSFSSVFYTKGDTVIMPKSQTPASASATCTAGTFAWDSNYLYQCIATNTWKRSAIATW